MPNNYSFTQKVLLLLCLAVFLLGLIDIALGAFVGIMLLHLK